METSRTARPTIGFVDEYCELFKGLFSNVPSYEAFKLLHLGMISDIKRKSLPAIAKAVGLENHQNLHHFLTESPWMVDTLRSRRLQLILDLLYEMSITLGSSELLVTPRNRRSLWGSRY